MGWEKRGSHEYFYTAERRNGRVVKHYWPGVTGELLAEQLEKSKRAQFEKQMAEKEIQDRLDRIDQSLAEFAELTQAAIQAVAFLNGFHFHRGEWRRKRGNETHTASQSETADVGSETGHPDTATRPTTPASSTGTVSLPRTETQRSAAGSASRPAAKQTAGTDAVPGRGIRM